VPACRNAPLRWWLFFRQEGYEKPGKRVFRFTLIGGGEICPIENWRVVTLTDGETGLECPWNRHKLIATLHDSHSVYPGMIDGQHVTDFSPDAAAFEGGMPHDVAERAAAMLSAIETDPDAFDAFLKTPKEPQRRSSTFAMRWCETVAWCHAPAHREWNGRNRPPRGVEPHAGWCAKGREGNFTH
jgi:hypothetical protein